MSPKTSKNCLQHEPKKIAFKPESGQGLKPLTVLLLAFYVEGIVQGLCPQQHIPADEPCLPTTASLLQRVNYKKSVPVESLQYGIVAGMWRFFGRDSRATPVHHCSRTRELQICVVPLS